MCTMVTSGMDTASTCRLCLSCTLPWQHGQQQGDINAKCVRHY
jgi:hypothetical protein